MPTTTVVPYRLYAPGMVASGQVDRGILPVVVRSGMEYQHVQIYGPSTLAYQSQRGAQIPHTYLGLMDPIGGDLPYGEVEVVSTSFAGESASLFVGPYEIVSGRDYSTAGALAVIATALAAAIDATPEYSAIAVGAVVQVTGKAGRIADDELRLDAYYRGGGINFSFTWPNREGFMGFPVTSPFGPPQDF